MLDDYIASVIEGHEAELHGDESHARLEQMSDELTAAREQIIVAQLRVQQAMTANRRANPPVLSDNHQDVGVNVAEQIAAKDAEIEELRRQLALQETPAPDTKEA